jgi:hemerythrin
MNRVHQKLASEHEVVRRQALVIKEEMSSKTDGLLSLLQKLQQAIQRHFQREEPYYRIVDVDRRLPDRELMHRLRNDHAAVIFSLESLLIRLRKQGADADWQRRYQNMLDVFLPHLDYEEQKLFPEAEHRLSPPEFDQIAHEIERLE